MAYDPDKHHRRSIRLEGYDYSQNGAYFVTMVTQNRIPFFQNTTIRRIAENCWLAIPQHFVTVIMPDHMHGIIIINRGVQLNTPVDVGQDKQNKAQLNVTADKRDPSNRFSMISPRRNTLSVVVRTFKAVVTTQCRRAEQVDFKWQRNYHERIIRDENHMYRTRQYIISNPSNESA